ncbi:hypothetical protein [Algibacter sp. PT7-4]|uniref:hypothetical protein n=1 Tax=Algibacter ulvanivorans TaxID=3400999 RepID=UPI003AAB70F3
MHFKYLIFFSVLLAFTSCKQSQDETKESLTQQNKTQDITEQDIATLKYVEYILDSKTNNIVKDWPEYTQLEEVITNVKKGDLSYFIDNEKVTKLLVKELKQNIPRELNSESILSRILVLETKLFQLESLSNLTTTTKEELLENIKAFLVSFSNLSFQMNKKIEFDNRSIEKP